MDATMNPTTGTTVPYRKSDDVTNYNHAHSDHPPTITSQLPLSIETRMSALSSSEAIFNDAKGYYQEALQRSGHDHVLKYNPAPPKRRKRRRNTIWFNPPFSKTVQTNIGKKFLQLIDTHFPPSNKFHKIFNRKTIKVSYGCMPNMGSLINAHNKKILEDNVPMQRGGCNCRESESCPLNGECLTASLMYEGTVSSSEPDYPNKFYVGISEPPFKARFGNHERDCNNEDYASTTELSKEVWKIKKRGFTPRVTWRILKQLPAYNPATKRCLLCLGEKMEILERNPKSQPAGKGISSR